MIFKSDFKQKPTISYVLLFHAGVHIEYVLCREIQDQWLEMAKVPTHLTLEGCP